jgi:3-oxoacyl-[acyl-carrier protein] reductase
MPAPTVTDSARTAVAIVTGSSRGIGRAIAEQLGSTGAKVIVNYRTNSAAADAVVAAINGAGGTATAVQADVSVVADVRRLFDRSADIYGAPTTVVHNAGITRFGAIAETTDQDYADVFDTNTRSTFAVLREAANRVPDGGRIVVISSGAAVVARANAGIYAASKAANDQLVRVLAKELGPRKITVNSVLPGPTRTEAVAATLTPDRATSIAAEIPLGRLAEPADIADVTAFLTSSASRWITGQTIHASGGMF